MALALLLGGCASVPVGIKVATLVGSGVSYVATGKSLGDHALSAASGQDCAMLRPLDGQPVCRGEPGGIPSAGDSSTAPSATAERASTPPPALAASPSPVPLRPAVPPPSPAERYLVAGSFLSAENAARHCESLQELHAVMVVQEQDGRRWHRVVVGPLGEATLRYRRQQLADLKQPGVWVLTIDTRSVPSRACAPPVQLAGG